MDPCSRHPPHTSAMPRCSNGSRPRRRWSWRRSRRRRLLRRDGRGPLPALDARSRGRRASCGTCSRAVGQSTRPATSGTGVTAPTFRWHPAVVAQASATLAAMNPGRHWLGVGSGRGAQRARRRRYWPEAAERINRMFEAVEIIRSCSPRRWPGATCGTTGTYFKLESTRLWTMPEVRARDPGRDGGPGHRPPRGAGGGRDDHEAAPLDKDGVAAAPVRRRRPRVGPRRGAMPKVLQPPPLLGADARRGSLPPTP